MKPPLPLLLLLPLVATADPGALSPDCATTGANSVVSACLEKALQAQQARLEQALHQALKALPPPRRAELQRTQELWRQYRDAKCRLLYTPESGSGGLLDMQQCLLDETCRRTGELAGPANPGP